MKLGVRKPNIKKRVRARTTGKAKRAVKSAINPLYGEKGTGLINDPKKAVYNKIYNKTTMSVDDLIEDATYGYEDDGIELFKVNEKRVQRVFKVCKKYLSHFQKSVFRGEMSPSKLIRFKTELNKVIDKNEDFICIIKLMNDNVFG